MPAGDPGHEHGSLSCVLPPGSLISISSTHQTDCICGQHVAQNLPLEVSPSDDLICGPKNNPGVSGSLGASSTFESKVIQSNLQLLPQCGSLFKSTHESTTKCGASFLFLVVGLVNLSPSCPSLPTTWGEEWCVGQCGVRSWRSKEKVLCKDTDRSIQNAQNMDQNYSLPHEPSLPEPWLWQSEVCHPPAEASTPGHDCHQYSLALVQVQSTLWSPRASQCS